MTTMKTDTKYFYVTASAEENAFILHLLLFVHEY